MPELILGLAIGIVLGGVLMYFLWSRAGKQTGLGKSAVRGKPLQRRVEELTILHAVATAGAEATSEDALIERASQIIGENLFPDNFGLMMVDEAAGLVRPHSSYRERDGSVEARVLPLGTGITGQVAASGNPRRVGDVRQDPDYLEVDPLTRSELCVPLRVGERVIGVINAESVKADDFTPADEQVLSTVAGQLATAIDRLRAESSVRRRANQLAILSRISQEVVASLVPGQVYTAVHQAAAQLMTADAFVIVLLDKSGKSLVPVYFVDRDRPVKADAIPAYRGLSGHVISTGEAMLINDREEMEAIDVVHAGEKEHARAVLAVPLRLGGKVFGMLSCQSYQPNAFNQDDLQTLITLANQAAIAIENARLFEETHQRLAEITFLSQIIAITATENDLSVALNRICSELAFFFRAPEVSFALLNSQLTSAQVIAEYHDPAHPDSQGVQIPVIGNPAMTYILESSHYLVIEDTHRHPLMEPIMEVIEQRGIVSLLMMPIVFGGEVVGTLEIASSEPRNFTEAEITLVDKVASQVGQVLERLGLFAATREQAERMAYLATISEGLNRPLSIGEVIGAIGEGAMLLNQAKRAVLFLSQEDGTITAPWFSGVSSSFVDQVTERVDELPGLLLINKSDPAQFTDLDLLPEDSFLKRLSLEEGFRSVEFWPLIYQDDVVAAITCYFNEPHMGTDAEQEVMLAFARQAAVALVNARLFDESRRRTAQLEALNAIIQDNARQVQHIIETVPEGVILLDDRHEIVLANPIAREYLRDLAGAETGDLLAILGGKPIDEILQPGMQVMWYELDVQGPPRRMFELSAQPLATGGRSEEWVIVLREVTQERENQTRIQMQERLATVGQLAAGIAHDFNNILAAIVVYSDLLKRDPNLLQASHDRIDVIQQQVHRAASLIRQILDFSRRSVMEQSRLDLLPFVKELDKLLRRVLPETIRLELTYQPGVFLVDADPARLQQVFINLAVNARDASPEGGTIQFKLDRVQILDGGPAPCPEVPPGTWVRITVKDTGDGIPPEVLSHIFEPFFTTKPVGQGTGLGLAQAYGIIKQHDGYIDVHSELGNGTTFHIYLPAREPVGEDLASTGPFVEAKGSGETILLVEDDFSAREALKTLLEDSNYHVLIASNGQEALEIYDRAAENIDLVVSDVVMPVMGGMALYERLLHRWPGVKMLFITGHPINEQDQAVLEKGNVHWLQKPFSVGVFNEAVLNLLRTELEGS